MITSNLKLAFAPGNVSLSRKSVGLNRDSVVNVSQLITLDKRFLSERVGRVSHQKMQEIDEGIRVVLAL